MRSHLHGPLPPHPSPSFFEEEPAIMESILRENHNSITKAMGMFTILSQNKKYEKFSQSSSHNYL